MSYFGYILINNILPLCIMIGLGVVMYRAFKVEIKTLSKLNLYLFSPAIIFKLLYESKLTLNVLGQVLLFFLLFFGLLVAVTQIVIRVRGYTGTMGSAVRNSVLFYNSGNYAVPLNQLVFVGDPFTLSVQLLIMMMQNLLPNTYGVYSVNAAKGDWRATAKAILILPSIYFIPLAFILKGFHVPIPPAIYAPLNYVANGFMGMALLTLGVQLGSMNWKIRFSDVAVSNGLRLCISPVLGYMIVLLLGLHGPMAQALVLSCAVPTSLSSVLLAIEYDNEPEFASQTAFASTLFSVFTVTLVIYLVQYL